MEQSDLGPHCLHAKFILKHQVLLFWWELIICMLGIFFIFCCRLLTLFEIFLKNSFRNTIRVSNGLDPDQDSCCRSKLFVKVISEVI